MTHTDKPPTTLDPDKPAVALAAPRPAITPAAHRRTTGPATSTRVDTARPVLALDVDGVLNPDPRRAARSGYQPHHYDGPDPYGRHVSGTVWLHPDHGDWLRELAVRADPVWCTSWNHLAAGWIAPRLGLPDDWPHVPVPGGGVRFGHQTKLGPLLSWAGGRPLAVLDDEFGGKDPDTATLRTAGGAPTLLHRVNPGHGLRRTDVDTVLAWLSRH